MDQNVNAILTAAIANGKAYPIWCYIKDGWQLEFVDYELTGGNSDLMASANYKENQQIHGQCSNSYPSCVPRKPLSNNQTNVTKGNVDKTMPQITVNATNIRLKND